MALPLLAAAYPVVFLFTSNAAEHVTMDPLWPPLLLSVGGAAVLLAVLLAIGREPATASLLTAVLVVSFFGYGHAWNGVAHMLDNQWPLIVVWLALSVAAFVLAWRAGRRAMTIVRGLALVAAFAVLLNAVGLGQTVAALSSPAPLSPSAGADIELERPAGQLPDVYYLVPDRYASISSLREFYSFDNEPFLAELEERGFRIANGAHANYTKTSLSLGSSLNLDYLDAERLQADATSVRDRGPIHRVLRDPLVAPRALKGLGYQYFHVGGWWGPSSTNVDADRVFAYDRQDTFTEVLRQTTLLRALSDASAAPDDAWDWPSMRASVEYQIGRLREIAEIAGPKYVFGHVMLPHPPYVFDADGSVMDRAKVRQLGHAEAYRRQLTYANGVLLDLVDRIIERSPDAVIVIQADEGPFPARLRANEADFDWREAADAELREKFGILFAMRIPGADLEAAGFHDAITPVNTFRVVFNARFDADLPILPDRIWTHVGVKRFYDFVDITDRLR